MATPTVNQFSMIPVLGQMDLEYLGSVVSAQASVNQATPLVAGQAVQIEDSAGGVPKLLAAVAGGRIDGFISRNLKDQNFLFSNANGGRCELAMDGSVMYMTAGAAIARGASVEIVAATPGTVITSAGINPVAGFAFDKAVNNGDLIRVFIKTPTGLTAGSAPKVARFTATLAQINAGLIAVPGVAGKQITVYNFTERVTGAFTTGTSVNLQSDTTSVIVEATAEAGLTNGAVLVPGSANVTLGAGFGVPFPAGEGLKVVNVGTAQAGGTSIAYDVEYTQA